MRSQLTRGLAITALLGVLALAVTSVGPFRETPADTPRVSQPAAVNLRAASVPDRVGTTGSVPTSGEDAIAALGPRLPAVARGYGWTTARLTETLRSDPTLYVDSNDKLFYMDQPVDSGVATETTLAAPETPAAAVPFPLADTFSLHSLPGAKLTIFLDFDGHTMSGNQWTATKNGGADIICPPWSIDGAANPGFNDAEKAAIQDIWSRVAEDYAPFNVDVTTEFTSEAAITRSSLSDLNYGTRVLISPISSYFGSYGGIAYLGIYSDTTDKYKPALVFPENLGPNSTKFIAEAASHECGHNLRLDHDGTSIVGYYAGSGSGVTGWAPVMGVGYNQNLSQWSRGEYPDANNQEDDLDILRGYLAYRADDVGNTLAAATVLPAAKTLAASGLISGSTDLDVYRFSAGAGTTAITVSPVAVGPNLDVYAEIRRPDGSVVAASNPDTLVSASFSVALPAGTYYLAVRGTGRLTPLDDGGYSNYGSIGQYTVSGTVPFAAPVTVATPTPSNAFANWVSSDVTIALAASEPIYGIASTRYSVNGAAAVTYAGAPVVLGTPGTTTFAYRSVGTAGDVETTNTVTVRIDKVKPATTISGLLGSYPAGGGRTIALSPSDALSGVAGTSWRIGTSGAFTSGVVATVPSAVGVYTLQYYSTDTAGNAEAVQSATVTVLDLTAPVTAATVAPAAASSTWVASNASVTLSASDAASGVAWTRYRLNGGDEIDYSAPLIFSSSGATTLSYRSADVAGNTEVAKTATIRVDKVKPTTTAPGMLTSYAAGAGGVIQLLSEDAHSGVATTRWRIGTVGAYTVGVAVPVPSAAGSYVLQYYATDSAGNIGDVQSRTFTVTDFTPPITTAGVVPASAAVGWVSSNATVTLSASDAVPGVAWTLFSVNGAAEQAYTTPIVVSQDGTITIAYRSQDGSGNLEATKTLNVYLDKTAPRTTALGISLYYAKNSGASITLDAADVGSGVSATQWRFGVSGAFTSGLAVPVPGGAGSYTLQYYSTDKVGNSEGMHTATITVGAAPVTRVAGKDRYETAAELARAGWDTGRRGAWVGVSDVIIANGEAGREADPIGAAGLAGAYGAPVLLTQKARLPGVTRAVLKEIAKANPGVRVHLIGGTSVVPNERWVDIKNIDGVSDDYHRVSGATRYSTSAAIAREIVEKVGEHRIQGVLVVAVDNPTAFYDALAASPIAYARTMPILGVRKSALESAAMKVLANELKGKTIYIVNSEKFVTRDVGMRMNGGVIPPRLATTSDPFKASTQIAQQAVSRGWLSPADTGLAAKLPDALTGGTYLGKRGGLLLFTNSTRAMAKDTNTYLATQEEAIMRGWVIGGETAVHRDQETSFRNLLQ